MSISAGFRPITSVGKPIVLKVELLRSLKSANESSSSSERLCSKTLGCKKLSLLCAGQFFDHPLPAAQCGLYTSQILGPQNRV